MPTHINQPTNVQRAQWARAALATFVTVTNGGDLETMQSGDLEDAVVDLACDLMHLAEYHPRMDARALHAGAMRHFEDETAEHDACDCHERSWYGPYHDNQCPVSAQAGKPRPPGVNDLLDALEGLLFSLSPNKVRPVLNAAGYGTDPWVAAHRHARSLLKRFKS
jgi:hypothetical protein